MRRSRRRRVGVPCFTSHCATPPRARGAMKNGCALLGGTHPSVPTNTLHNFPPPSLLVLLLRSPQRGGWGGGGVVRGIIWPLVPLRRRGVSYETRHPRGAVRPPDHSPHSAKPPLSRRHYPFNVSRRGVGFPLLRLIQVQSIITRVRNGIV